MLASFRRRARVLAAMALITVVAACGGSAAPPPMTGDARTQAAASTALNNASCRAIQPFYWEIGNREGTLAGDTAGGSTPTATTPMLIASASKWMFGAYVVQLRNGQLSANDLSALRMLSGHTNLSYVSCKLTSTVDGCFNAINASGHNSDLDASAVGKFHYNGGHFQWLADTDLQLGSKNNAALQSAIAAQLGAGIAFTYDSPQLAAGVQTTGQDYATFLRRVLGQQLLMHDQLGANAVCTNPATCAQALYAPIPASESWHYSVGHWVEDDPVAGDGAFSSPGAFGFYPWIDASKIYYGVLARQVSVSLSGNDPVAVESVLCGRLIRKAWLTATAQ